MEGMVEVEGDNIFWSLDRKLICTEAVNDDIPSPLCKLLHCNCLWPGVPFIACIIWRSSFFIFYFVTGLGCGGGGVVHSSPAEKLWDQKWVKKWKMKKWNFCRITGGQGGNTQCCIVMHVRCVCVANHFWHLHFFLIGINSIFFHFQTSGFQFCLRCWSSLKWITMIPDYSHAGREQLACWLCNYSWLASWQGFAAWLKEKCVSLSDIDVFFGQFTNKTDILWQVRDMLPTFPPTIVPFT